MQAGPFRFAIQHRGLSFKRGIGLFLLLFACTMKIFSPTQIIRGLTTGTCVLKKIILREKNCDSSMSCFLYMCQKGICAYLKFQIFFCRRHTRSSCDEILMGCPLCCARGWGGIECSCSLSFLLVASVGRHFDGNSFVGCFERNVAGCMFIRYLLMRDREGEKIGASGVGKNAVE